jgi:hypothetical protein
MVSSPVYKTMPENFLRILFLANQRKFLKCSPVKMQEINRQELGLRKNIKAVLAAQRYDC